MIKIKSLCVLTLTAGLLCGCSENGFFFRSGDDYDDGSDQAVYYIGEPYRLKGILYTPAEDLNYSAKGAAAWYVRDTQNRLTTNGEVFDENKMTAAHKTLPLPSIVRITNLDNGNTAIVRVNDRGPAVNNRLIDVSPKVAEALEMPETGTVMVQVDILREESLQAKAELEEYVEWYDDDADEKPSQNVPVYQPQVAALEPIYDGEAVEALPPTSDKTDLPVATKKIVRVEQTGGSFAIQAGVFSNPANVDKAISKLGTIAPVETDTKGTLTIVRVGPFTTKEEAERALKLVKEAGYKDAWIKK